MSPLTLAFILLALGFAFSALFSGAETAAYTFNRTRHRLRLAEGDARAQLVERLTRDVTAFVVVCLIGTNLSNALVSFCATLAAEELRLSAPELVATLTVGPLRFILGELAPKEMFRRHPDSLLYGTGRLLAGAQLLFRPAVVALSGITWALRVLGLRTDSARDQRAEERLRQAIAAGGEVGTLTGYQTTLARNIFSLRTITVRHVMIPLAQVDVLEAGTELEKGREFARSRGHSRYPVYRYRRREVIGVVDLYELEFDERPGLTIRNYVQPVPAVAPDEKVAEALVRLRRARARLAIVSEGGRALGIVTTKDLVEEITGELEDL